MIMTDIKNAINIVTQLSEKTEDKELASKLLQIQSLISSILMENSVLTSKNLELEKKILDLEKGYAKDTSGLREKRSNKGSVDKYIFNETYGVYESSENGHYICTSCLLKKGVESPLKKDPEGLRCQSKGCSLLYSSDSKKD